MSEENFFSSLLCQNCKTIKQCQRKEKKRKEAGIAKSKHNFEQFWQHSWFYVLVNLLSSGKYKAYFQNSDVTAHDIHFFALDFFLKKNVIVKVPIASIPIWDAKKAVITASHHETKIKINKWVSKYYFN